MILKQITDEYHETVLSSLMDYSNQLHELLDTKTLKQEDLQKAKIYLITNLSIFKRSIQDLNVDAQNNEISSYLGKIVSSAEDVLRDLEKTEQDGVSTIITQQFRGKMDGMRLATMTLFEE